MVGEYNYVISYFVQLLAIVNTEFSKKSKDKFKELFLHKRCVDTTYIIIIMTYDTVASYHHLARIVWKYHFWQTSLYTITDNALYCIHGIMMFTLLPQYTCIKMLFIIILCFLQGSTAPCIPCVGRWRFTQLSRFHQVYASLQTTITYAAQPFPNIHVHKNSTMTAS